MNKIIWYIMLLYGKSGLSDLFSGNEDLLFYCGLSVLILISVGYVIKLKR
jgi:hypothetical protein